VLTYPNIKGIETSLFFMDHSFPEDTNNNMQSKLNTQEAEVIVRFARYLMQQKYSSSQITILTLYTGQLLHIKKLIGKDEIFKDLRVTNVDNY
jgi:superfamily I DNA and/or RNA helicase